MIPTRPRLPNPASAGAWMAVASLRLAEARRISDEKGCVASAYLAGYAIECSLKAFLANRGSPRPAYGSEGHNLRSLWAACDFILRDIQDLDGSKNYYMTDWTTDLPYQSKKNTMISDQDLIIGAGKVLSRLHTQIRRDASKRR
jgi:hypothetical protein